MENCFFFNVTFILEAKSMIISFFQIDLEWEIHAHVVNLKTIKVSKRFIAVGVWQSTCSSFQAIQLKDRDDSHYYHQLFRNMEPVCLSWQKFTIYIANLQQVVAD